MQTDSEVNQLIKIISLNCHMALLRELGFLEAMVEARPGMGEGGRGGEREGVPYRLSEF